MKNNAKLAYDVLKKAGMVVMTNNWSREAHFEISVEEMPDALPNGPLYWADMDDLPDGSVALNDLIDKHGLFWEWLNNCVIGVYDA
jgi:hypothetical protein